MHKKRFHIVYCTELSPDRWEIKCDCSYKIIKDDVTYREAWKIAEKHVRWIPIINDEWKRLKNER